MSKNSAKQNIEIHHPCRVVSTKTLKIRAKRQNKKH